MNTRALANTDWIDQPPWTDPADEDEVDPAPDGEPV